MKIININAHFPPAFPEGLSTTQKQNALASSLLSDSATVANHLSKSSHGAGAVRAIAPVSSSDPNTTIDYSFQALAEIAELHLLILQANPSWNAGTAPPDSMAAPQGANYGLFCSIATDLVKNLASKCDPAIQSVITMLTKDFVQNPDGSVNNCYWTRFHWDWTQAPDGTKGNGGHGLADVCTYLASTDSSGHSIFDQYYVTPMAGGAGNRPNGPMGYLFLTMFFADFITVPNTDKFSSFSSGDSFFESGGATPFTTLIPYYSALALYQIDTTMDPADISAMLPGSTTISQPVTQKELHDQMQYFFNMMPSSAIIQNYHQGEDETCYDQMTNHFTWAMNDVLETSEMPPPTWVGDQIGTDFGVNRVPFGKPLPVGTDPYSGPCYNFFIKTMQEAFEWWL